MLQNKNAIVYGGGGSLGGAVAKALASSGAKVFLTGRNLSSVQKVADEITASGGVVQFDEVDALNENSVNDHLQRVFQIAGSVDISFNAIGITNVQGVPLVELSANDFVSPITLTMQTQFLTAIAASKAMIVQRSGVILSLTATPGGIGYPFTGGFAPACCALESFSRNLASELGVYGIRVVNIRSGGSPDSRIFEEAINRDPKGMKTVLGKMEEDAMLKRLPSTQDIANVAVFVSSDMAKQITGVTIDVTGGSTAALNYRIPREV